MRKISKFISSLLLMSILSVSAVNVFAEELTLTLNVPTEEIQLTKEVPWSYVNAAREAYITDAYADYTTSVIQDYSRDASYYDDRPNPVYLFRYLFVDILYFL